MILFMRYIYVPLREAVHNAVAGIPTPYIIMLAVVLSIDFLSSFRTMYLRNGSNILWKVEAGLSDHTLKELLKIGH